MAKRVVAKYNGQGTGSGDTFSTSAELLALLSDPTGTGLAVFNDAPEFTSLTFTGATYTPSGSTLAINLATAPHVRLRLTSGTGLLTATLTVPAAMSSGIIYVKQHATTVRDLAFSSLTTISWIGTEPDWNAAATGTEWAIAWSYNGDKLYLQGVVNGLPVGGTSGQALVKASNADYDVEWADVDGTVALPTETTNGVISMTTEKSSGTFLIYASCTSNYYRVLWWDGSVTAHGSNTNAVKAIPGAGSRAVLVWPATLVDNSVAGEFATFIANNNDLSSLSISYSQVGRLLLVADSYLETITGLTGNTSITNLGVTTGCNSMLELDCSGCTSLITLTVDNCNSLTQIEASDAPVSGIQVQSCNNLVTINVPDCTMESLTIQNCPSLTTLTFSNTVINLELSNVAIISLDLATTSVQNLDVQYCAQLEDITFRSNAENVIIVSCNSLTSVGLSDRTGLISLIISYCSLLEDVSIAGCTTIDGFQIFSNESLSSVDATGCVLSKGVVYTNTTTSPSTITTTTYQDFTILTNNNLGAAALDAFYDGLAETIDVGVIDVGGNPGVTGHEPSIASSKNYIIIGT